MKHPNQLEARIAACAAPIILHTQFPDPPSRVTLIIIICGTLIVFLIVALKVPLIITLMSGCQNYGPLSGYPTY